MSGFSRLLSSALTLAGCGRRRYTEVVPQSRLPSVELMQATQVTRPFHREGWVYEEKVDGWRMLAYKVGDEVRLVSRNGRDHTKRFPDLAGEVRKLDASPLILDGEVAVFDAKLMSRFEWLRQQPPEEASTPPVFIAFDCLLIDKKDIRERPLFVRRNVLENLLEYPNLVLPVRRLSDDGMKAWQQVLELGFEGVVAKDPASPYRGGRTLSWLKVKQRDYRVEARGWDSR